MAAAFNRKITVIPAARSRGFAFITGVIAAIAVPPHIAVPEEIKIANLRSIPSNQPISNPPKKVQSTKIDIKGK